MIYLTCDGSFAKKERLAFDILMGIGSLNALKQGVNSTERTVRKLIDKFSTTNDYSSFIVFRTVDDAEAFIYFCNKFFGTYLRSQKSICLKRIKKFFKRFVK